MEHVLKILLCTTHGGFAYLTVFAVLVACGLGIPLPEDLSLISGGLLAYQGRVGLAAMMAVGFVGILVGDSLTFFAGRRIGRQAARGHGFFCRIVTPEKRAKVECLFGRHGQKIVMLARFLPGVRAVTYFTAGSAGMSFPQFICFDGFAASFSAPLFVYLGFRFGSQLEFLVHKMREFELSAAALIILGLVTYFIVSRRKAALAPSLLGCSEAQSPRELTPGERPDFAARRAATFSGESLAPNVELSK